MLNDFHPTKIAFARLGWASISRSNVLFLFDMLHIMIALFIHADATNVLPSSSTSSWQPGADVDRLVALGRGEDLQVTLTIQGCREGGVVECAGHTITTSVRCHSLDTVLCLIRWQLPPEDISSNIRLKHTRQCNPLLLP